MQHIDEVIEKVPKWEKYYTVDELHESSAKLVNDYPKKVDLIDLGKSTNGEIIDCLKIGKGKYNAFIHGFPNLPNGIKYKLLRDFLPIENSPKDDFLD